MEKTDEIRGAEGIIIHNGNIVLGMQKPKRWYKLENGETITMIKTLGGEIEKEDEGDSKKALIREVIEEVNGIGREDIRVSNKPIFTKRIRLADINPFEKKSNLNMNADFYLLQILKQEVLQPNDLPALIEIPLSRFIKMEFNSQGKMRNIQDYISQNTSIDLPDYYRFMIPEEVHRFFREIRKDREDIER